MLSWQRILLVLALAMFETAPAALVVTIAGGDAWLFLIIIALGGILAARLTERYLPERIERVVLLALALPLSIWAALTTGIGGTGYVVLLATLYSFWRGTLLAEHDRVTIARVFGRIVVAMIIIIGLGSLAASLTSQGVAIAASEVIAFFGAGLLAVALANLDDSSSGQRNDWRGVAMIAGSVVAIIVGGVLITSLFGGTLGSVLGAIWQAVALAFLLMVSPILYIFGWIAERFAGMLDQQAIQQFLQGLQARAAQQPQRAAQQLNAPEWIGLLLQAFCFIVPICLAVLLFLLIRRRRQRGRTANEERESLLSWQSLSSDLSDLLAGLRRKTAAHGLRDALAQLRGSDPVSRIRRSYIRMLLAAEARDLQRRTAQTPSEFAPAAVSSLAPASGAVASLTSTYERARYAPSTTSDADAAGAERDWGEIEGGTRP